MYSKPNLEKFFQEHPSQNRLELALDVIIRKAKSAKQSLQSEDENEFLYHLAEVHDMVEKILEDVGTHKDAIKQHYPNGVAPRPRKEGEYKNPAHENPRSDVHPNPYRPIYPAGYRYY